MSQRSYRSSLLGAACLLSSAISCFAQQIPPIDVTTLTGTRVLLPQPGGGKPLLILVTFSRKGSADADAWNKHFKTVYETDPRVQYLELADLQGVPSFVLSMILHGMRRSVAEPERSHLAPMFSTGDDWKKLVGANDLNVTYVVLANPAGHVVWQTSGPATDQKAADLQAAVAAAATPSH